jgi:hypothetical protein
VHTARALNADTISVTIEDRDGDVFDVFPGFDKTDRVGVVLTAPHGALGASLLYLAAVHAFYELERQESDDFWIYPDFYFFHVGARHGHHGSLDVWPDHKEVEVPAEPDRILEAINDRAITRLIVPDDPGAEFPRGREALASYEARIRGAFAYSPTGAVTKADIAIAGSIVTEEWVRDALDPEGLIERLGPGEEAAAVQAHSDEVPAATRTAIAGQRQQLIEEGRPRETYRRITRAEALARLVPSAPRA